MTERQQTEPSLGELFARLANDTSNLVRQEVNLARTEISQKATSMGRDAGILAAGGVLAFAGFLVLLATAVIVLDLFMPLWLAALLVGLIVTGIGGFLAMQGLNALKRANLVPEQTIQTLKEDAQWAKEQTK